MSKITAKAPKANRELSVEVNLGANHDEALALFGAELVFNGFQSAAVIAAQNAVRRLLEAGKTDEEIASTMSTWKPGMKIAGGGDPVANLKNKLAKMDPAEAKALLAELKKSLG